MQCMLLQQGHCNHPCLEPLMQILSFSQSFSEDCFFSWSPKYQPQLPDCNLKNTHISCEFLTNVSNGPCLLQEGNKPPHRYDHCMMLPLSTLRSWYSLASFQVALDLQSILAPPLLDLSLSWLAYKAFLGAIPWLCTWIGYTGKGPNSPGFTPFQRIIKQLREYKSLGKCFELFAWRICLVCRRNAYACRVMLRKAFVSASSTVALIRKTKSGLYTVHSSQLR